jgi:hypothetical protein
MEIGKRQGKIGNKKLNRKIRKASRQRESH